MSEVFGNMEFEAGETDENGEGIFHRVDPAPYRAAIVQLQSKPAGYKGKVTVPTGEIIQTGKSSKGRGKSELSDARNFQAAASEAGLGLRVSWRHNLTGELAGTTTLRMMLAKKRTFSEETVQKRTLALEERRLRNAQAKLASDPTNKEFQARVQVIQERMQKAAGKPAASKQ